MSIELLSIDSNQYYETVKTFIESYQFIILIICSPDILLAMSKIHYIMYDNLNHAKYVI